MVIQTGNLELILIIEMFTSVYNYIYSKKINSPEKNQDITYIIMILTIKLKVRVFN